MEGPSPIDFTRLPNDYNAGNASGTTDGIFSGGACKATENSATRILSTTEILPNEKIWSTFIIQRRFMGFVIILQTRQS